MQVGLSLAHDYTLTEDDMDYLRKHGISYCKNTRTLRATIRKNHSFELERVKNALRKVPNTALYAAFQNDFRVLTAM